MKITAIALSIAQLALTGFLLVHVLRLEHALQTDYVDLRSWIVDVWEPVDWLRRHNR